MDEKDINNSPQDNSSDTHSGKSGFFGVLKSLANRDQDSSQDRRDDYNDTQESLQGTKPENSSSHQGKEDALDDHVNFQDDENEAFGEKTPKKFQSTHEKSKEGSPKNHSGDNEYGNHDLDDLQDIEDQSSDDPPEDDPTLLEDDDYLDDDYLGDDYDDMESEDDSSIEDEKKEINPDEDDMDRRSEGSHSENVDPHIESDSHESSDHNNSKIVSSDAADNPDTEQKDDRSHHEERDLDRSSSFDEGEESDGLNDLLNSPDSHRDIDDQPLNEERRIDELDKVAHQNLGDDDNTEVFRSGELVSADEVDEPESHSSYRDFGDYSDNHDGHASTDAEGRLLDGNGNVIYGEGAGEPNPLQHIDLENIPKVSGDEYRGSDDDYYDPYRDELGLNEDNDSKKKGFFASTGAWILIGLLSALLIGSLIYSFLTGSKNNESENTPQPVTVTKTGPGRTSTDTVVDSKPNEEKDKRNAAALNDKDKRIKELEGDVKTAQNSAKDAQQRNRGLQSQVNKLKDQAGNPRVRTETETKTLPPRVVNQPGEPTTVREPASTVTSTKTKTNTTVRTIVTTVTAPAQ